MRLLLSGRKSIARHSVITSDAEIDEAIKRAGRLRTEPRLVHVDYNGEPQFDLFVLGFSDSSRIIIGREDLQGLQTATKDQIENFQILGNGTGIRWSELDVDLYVPNLVRGIYGNKQWMSEIGRRGGAVKSDSKTRASRANGAKGGRPRKTMSA